MKKKNIIISAIVFVVMGGMFFLWSGVIKSSSATDNQANKVKAVVYKSPTCGCCVNHIAYLKENSFDVETIATNDMQSIKKENGVPSSVESCHTTLIDGYFIDGHVPIEAIDKLLTEQPKIDGIALPGMPAGSPGMPGTKSGTFDVVSVNDGIVSEFISL
ncbi:DUF411 domain-containing protein [Patescibacteria group bacterium]